MLIWLKRKARKREGETATVCKWNIMEAQKLIKHITTNCVMGSSRLPAQQSKCGRLCRSNVEIVLRCNPTKGGGIIFMGACRFNQSYAWKQIRQVFGEICGIWDHSKNLPIGIIDQADRRTQTISQYFIRDSDGFFFFFFSTDEGKCVFICGGSPHLCSV